MEEGPRPTLDPDEIPLSEVLVARRVEKALGKQPAVWVEQEALGRQPPMDVEPEASQSEGATPAAPPPLPRSLMMAGSTSGAKETPSQPLRALSLLQIADGVLGGLTMGTVRVAKLLGLLLGKNQESEALLREKTESAHWAAAQALIHNHRSEQRTAQVADLESHLAGETQIVAVAERAVEELTVRNMDLCTQLAANPRENEVLRFRLDIAEHDKDTLTEEKKAVEDELEQVELALTEAVHVWPRTGRVLLRMPWSGTDLARASLPTPYGMLVSMPKSYPGLMLTAKTPFFVSFSRRVWRSVS